MTQFILYNIVTLLENRREREKEKKKEKKLSI